MRPAVTAWQVDLIGRAVHFSARCASCDDELDLAPYGPVSFCRECREQAEEFAGKELYCDFGGGD